MTLMEAMNKLYSKEIGVTGKYYENDMEDLIVKIFESFEKRIEDDE